MMVRSLARRCMGMLALAWGLGAHGQESPELELNRSQVSFISEAPLETIGATNRQLEGKVDRAMRTFSIKVPMVAFKGFNSPLQREHFNENYMATAQWPFAGFEGRIIEEVDLRQPGTYKVRAKGLLTIRGVSIERIVPCTLEVGPAGTHVRSSFEVVLSDHGIRIPRVVERKVAATVLVRADLYFGAAKP
jgi:hypothetical protein